MRTHVVCMRTHVVCMRTHGFMHEDTWFCAWGHMIKFVRTHDLMHEDTWLNAWGHMLHITCVTNKTRTRCRRRYVRYSRCLWVRDHNHVFILVNAPLRRIRQTKGVFGFALCHFQVPNGIRLYNAHPLLEVIEIEVVKVLVIWRPEKISFDIWLYSWGHTVICMRTHGYIHEDTWLHTWGHMLEYMRTHGQMHEDTWSNAWGHMVW